MTTKELYLIRHGTSLHNILFWEIGSSAYTRWRDTPLMHQGFCEANELSSEWKNIDDIELVIVSPLLRTLQTATTIFNKHKKELIACDLIVEHPIGGSEICNRRKDKALLENLFPEVDYTALRDVFKWKEERESEEELAMRLETFKDYLRSRSENKIAVVAHSCVINKLLYGNIGDEQGDLDKCRHCHPYYYRVEL